MFSRGKLIKVLKKENDELLLDVRSKASYIRRLHAEIAVLNEQLAPFKVILNNSKLKPAVSKFCELCEYRVMSGSNVVGCCKGNVCEDFERRESNEPG